MNTVYVCLKNSIDWSGPPPVFAGVGKTPGDALLMAYSGPEDRARSYVAKWLADEGEERAYFTVRAFDMQFSPPREIERPDFKRGGGPVQDG